MTNLPYKKRLTDESIYGYVESKSASSSDCYNITISIVEAYRCKDSSLYPVDKKVSFKNVNFSDAKELHIGAYVAVYIKPDGSMIGRVYALNKKLETLNHKEFSDSTLTNLNDKYNIVFIGSNIGYGDAIKEHRLANIIDLSPPQLDKYQLIEAFKSVERLQADGIRVDILALGVGGNQTHNIFSDQQVIYHFNRIPNVTKYIGLGHFNTINCELRRFATKEFRSPTEMGLELENKLNAALEKLSPPVIQPIIHQNHTQIVHNNNYSVKTEANQKSHSSKMWAAIGGSTLLASIAFGIVLYDKLTPSNASEINKNIESTPVVIPSNNDTKLVASKAKRKIKKPKKAKKKASAVNASTPSTIIETIDSPL